MKKLSLCLPFALLFGLILTACSLENLNAQETVKAPSKPQDMFASADLNDWDFYLTEKNVKKEDVWSFKTEKTGNVLCCKGNPFGYLTTKKEYKNFKIDIQWCWPEGVKPVNSGVFVYLSGDDSWLPNCYECQLQAGNAGDILAFQNLGVKSDDWRLKKQGNMTILTRINSNENEPGQWNDYEIICNNGMMILSVNGKVVNWTFDVSKKSGKIALQSEGGEVRFRKFFVTELP